MNDAQQQPCKGFRARRGFVRGLLAVAMIGLVWRAVDLQWNHKDFLQTEGDARSLRTVKIPAHRGRILDRNGEPLAVSTPVDSIWVNPNELAQARDDWPRLGELLGIDVEDLERQFAARRGREFVYLRRHVAPGLASRVRGIGISGVYLQREYGRYYPFGETAAHVVGFTNVDDEGQEGVELAFDSWLRGVDGAKRVVRDRLGRAVEDVDALSSPRAGRDLTLSIDQRVQYIAYRALLAGVKRHRARGGSAVVIDARTGEILAMVNQPAYNPNNRTDRVSARFRNRAVTDVFEPGSTIKPFTIAAALESGRFTPDSRIDTRPGLMKVGKHTVKDLRDYGVIDLTTVVKKSSNVGASKVALELAPRELWKMFHRLGFGAPSGSGFPGESPGSLTDFQDWGEIHRATLSFGYGLSVNALQLAQAYAAIANDGQMAPASFERVEAPTAGPRIMSRKAATEVRDMLESVVGPGGTAARARVAGYRVGGKTGTVRKSIIGGYAEDRYMALFAGMGPMSHPRLVTVVVVDEPSADEYYGGQVAAPVFAEIMTGAMRALGVAPDDRTVVTRRVLVDRQRGGQRGGQGGRVRPVPFYAGNARLAQLQPGEPTK